MKNKNLIWILGKCFSIKTKEKTKVFFFFQQTIKQTRREDDDDRVYINIKF